ncbi:MAG: tetratricopeptide repeat protein [Betaproteobacteria bacterium]|nr:tetratricopeptide repeat protein [Betaproteobacteria bacterium]
MLDRLFDQLFGQRRRRPQVDLQVNRLLDEAASERLGGRPENALSRLISLGELAPSDFAVWNELGLTYRALGRAADAASAFAEATRLSPQDVAAHVYLGNLAHERDALDDAVRFYRRAVEIAPDNPGIRYNLALTYLSRGEAEAAVAEFRRVLDLDPAHGDARSSLLFSLTFCHGLSPGEVEREHREWADRFAEPLARNRLHANVPDPDRVLRIGYVSADFLGHVAASFIQPLLAYADPAHFRVFCYSNSVKPRQAGGALAEGVTWREIADLDDDASAALIQADAIDLLVDLSGHTRGNRLLVFARKPAPLQITYLGYPNTTGMSAMDYRITDNFADPPGPSDARYRERLLRLPHSLWCFQPPGHIQSTRAARDTGGATFGSMNNVVKLQPPLIVLWARILRDAPDSRLVLATIPAGSARQRLLDIFSAHGVAADRIAFYDRLPQERFRALHQEIDLALDAYPCNGGGTTCESLWLGVPVLTLCGEVFQSRAGFSLLSAVGLNELIANSGDEYVAKAVALARDPQMLKKIRSLLPSQFARSPLVDGPGFVRDLEWVYRQVWRDWCAAVSVDRAVRPA